MNDTAAILLLSELPGIGEKTLADLLRHCAVRRLSATDALTLEAGALCELGLSERSAAAVRSISKEMAQAAEATARSLVSEGVVILTPLDACYPKRLLERLTDPPVLFAYGALDVLDAPTFAVACSNGASEASLAACDSAAEELVQQGHVPITGHNRPVYQRAALAALRFGGKVCYVLDRGLLEAFSNDLRRELFPAAHVWSRQYDPATTLTLTPYPLRAHGIAIHNRRRDELVFALADTILAGEIRPGGQMEKHVRAAREGEREVRRVGSQQQ